MAAKVLNIEVGDRLTKVCTSVRHGKTYQIRNSFMFQTPDNAVSDGNVAAPDALAEALVSQLSSHGLSGVKSVIFALTSGRIASREVMLPPVKDNRLKGVVDSNAADYFPVDLTKYHVTYTLLERVTKGENPGCRVSVLAAPLPLLEGYFTLAEKAKLTIKAIDFSGNSQYQALRALADKDVTMYVNVDCNSSFVTFMQGGKLLLQRAFTFGGDDLILGYMNAAGKAPADYVDALRECSVAEDLFLASGSLAKNDIDDNLSRLVSNIVRSTDYFNSNHWDLQVEKVVLMGSCSHLVGLRDLVASGTGLNTLYLDDLPGITSFANMADSASFYISCIGSSIAPLDFLPPQFVADKKKTSKKAKSSADSLTGGVAICAVCVAAAIVLSAVSILGYRSARDEKADTERKIAELAPAKTTYDQYVSYKAGADSLTQFSSSISSPNDDLSDFISELEQKMPSQILVLSAVCSQDGVSMNVGVPEFKDAAAVLAQLRTFESIGNITAGAVTETEDATSGKYVSFSVNCVYAATLKRQEAAAAAAKAKAAKASSGSASSSAASK